MAINHLTLKKLSAEARKLGKQRKCSERIEVGSGSKGIGSMKLVCLPSGSTRIYYVYRSREGKQIDFPLGELVLSVEDKNRLGGNAYTLAEARQLSMDAAKAHLKSLDEGYSGLRDSQQPVRSEADISLKSLMMTYMEIKSEEGKSDYVKDVESVCGRYLFNESVALIDANKVDKVATAKILRKVLESGKKRTYQKLRSFLLAAYNSAIDAEYDEGCDSRLIPFGIREIPIGKNRQPDALKVNTRDRFLTEGEIGVVWKYLDKSNSYMAEFVKLKLLSGQRTVQLLRVTFKNVNISEKSLTLYDKKGRRTKPREHVVVFDSLGWGLINKFMAQAKLMGSQFVFNNSESRQLSSDSVYRFVKIMSDSLLGQGLIEESFTVSDLRRTWETHAAKLGVSKDLRGQVASHGISGVQDSHYDRYDYMSQKREVAQKVSDEMMRLAYGSESNIVIYRG